MPMKQTLLVEGRDDQHVIWALCERFNLPENFEVKPTDGVEKLFRRLPVELKGADVTTIGIIIDADEDINDRWATVQRIFQERLPDFPALPNPDGTVFEQNNLKVGVWLMPDNQANGMLETFIDFLIPPHDVLRTFVAAHLAEVEKEGLNGYRLIHRDKAFIHAWLALQEDPGTPLGLSITKKYLTTDAEQCQKLINWLHALFD